MSIIFTATQTATKENSVLRHKVVPFLAVKYGDEVVFPVELDFDGLDELKLPTYSNEELRDILEFISTGKVLINEIELDRYRKDVIFINAYIARCNLLIAAAQQAQQAEER